MKILFLIFSSFIILSCTHDKASQASPVPITEIDKESLYGAGAEGIHQSNFVITNTTDWQNLMTQMNSTNNVTDNFAETNIDFNIYEIVAVFDEVRSNGGWTTEISSITETATEISVAYHFSSGNGGFATCVITQPFHIVKIPKSSKPVNFYLN